MLQSTKKILELYDNSGQKPGDCWNVNVADGFLFERDIQSLIEKGDISAAMAEINLTQKGDRNLFRGFVSEETPTAIVIELLHGAIARMAENHYTLATYSPNEQFNSSQLGHLLSARSVKGQHLTVADGANNLLFSYQGHGDHKDGLVWFPPAQAEEWLTKSGFPAFFVKEYVTAQRN